MDIEELKEAVELVLTRIQDDDPAVRRSAALQLKKTVRDSTGTVTSIPQAIKHLREHIPLLFSLQQEFANEEAGQHVADVLAIVSLTYPTESSACTDNLSPVDFILKGTPYSIIMWGLEFQRMITAEAARMLRSASIDESESSRKTDLHRIVVLSVDSLMTNGFLQDAVDVLQEAGLLSELLGDYMIPEDDNRISQKLRKERETIARERMSKIHRIERALKRGMGGETVSDTSSGSSSPEPEVSEEGKGDELHVALQSNVLRIAHYLTETALVLPPDETEDMYSIIYFLLLENEEYIDAIRIALRLRRNDLVTRALGHLIAIAAERPAPVLQALVDIVLTDRKMGENALKEIETADSVDVGTVKMARRIASRELNGALHSYALAQYDSATPLKIEDIMKLHVEDINFPTAVLNSSLLRKADIVASGFANAGAATDHLLTIENSAILQERQSHTPADTELAAFMHGALNLWTGVKGANVIAGLLNNKDSVSTRIGGIAALGACFSNTTDGANPVLALVRPYCEDYKKYNYSYRIAAAVAIAQAHAGTNNEAATELLLGMMKRQSDEGSENSSNESTIRNAKNEYLAICHACLALGLVWAGSLNEERLFEIFEVFQSWSESFVIRVSASRLALCGIGCLMTARGDDSRPLIDQISELELFPDTIQPFLTAICYGYAYVSSNNVSKVNDLLAQIAETHTTKVKIAEEMAERDVITGKAEERAAEESKKEEDEKMKLMKEVAASGGEPEDFLSLQSRANIGAQSALSRETERLSFESVEPLCDESAAAVSIALIANTDDTGVQVTRRLLDRCLQFGSTPLTRGCPWAYAALCPSSPSVAVMEAIERLTTADDLPTACGALLSLGLVGYGSANSRLISSLRKHIARSSFVSAHVSCAEMAMGLLFAGRSSARLRTSHSEGFIPNTVGSAAYASFLFSMCNDWNMMMALTSKAKDGTKAQAVQRAAEPSLMPWALLLLATESRAAVAVTTDGTPVTMKVRVGNAEEGSRTGVTGAQTAKTPAMVSPDERIIAVEGAFEAPGRILDSTIICQASQEEGEK